MSKGSEYNWALSRRAFITTLASGSAIGAMPLSLRAYAAQFDSVPLDEYESEFLNDTEWAFVMAATARLIPDDGDGPSAHDTHVPVFIDRQLAGDFGQAVNWYMKGPHQPDAPAELGYQTPLTPAEIYRQGIKAIDVWCNNQYGRVFAELEDDQQDDVLSALEAGDIALDTELKDFFSLLLGNAKEGYFADPMYGGNHNLLAWGYIGFPGARAGYLEWAGQHNTEYPLGPVSISGQRG